MRYLVCALEVAPVTNKSCVLWFQLRYLSSFSRGSFTAQRRNKIQRIQRMRYKASPLKKVTCLFCKIEDSWQFMFMSMGFVR